MRPAANPESFAKAFAQRDLVLYAGTNLACAIAEEADIEQMSMMPVIGAGEHKQQPNVAGLAQIEARAADLLCELFRGQFADARFHSCTRANLAVFTALLKPGDVVLCLQASDGGHPSQNGEGMLAHLAVRLIAVPFDAARQCVDDVATAQLVERLRPVLVVIGPSVIVRPSALGRTAAAATRVGAVLVVDVSHVAGLIAAGVFPNPLDEGADILTASSYKTLGCPPSGFVVGRTAAFASRIATAASPRLASNYDAGRLFRFASALRNLRGTLADYAAAVLLNAQALREGLVAAGVAVLTPDDGVFGTHQVVIPAGSKLEAERIVMQLQLSGITTSTCGVPGKAESWGVRLGTQLVTRRGMGVLEMRRIADMLAAVITEQARDLRAQVNRLTSDFTQVRFCGECAHG